MKKNLDYLIKLLRVKQWIKNAFIFFPLIFSGYLLNKDLFIATILAFSGFCFISSGLYILNDFLDHKRDRLHPKKANRPLTQGTINKPQIIFVIISLEFLGLWICQNINNSVFTVALFYIGFNLVYNFLTKKIVILDVIFIALGFYLRIWAGAVAINVIPSIWIQMCAFLLALFLGFTKRRYEIATLKDNAAEHRSVLAHYSSYLLDQIIIICSTLAIVFYSLYTISPEVISRVGTTHMVYSIGFVIYGIFRYLYLIHVKKLGDDPSEILLKDMPLMICVFSWVAYVGFIIYAN